MLIYLIFVIFATLSYLFHTTDYCSMDLQENRRKCNSHIISNDWDFIKQEIHEAKNAFKCSKSNSSECLLHFLENDLYFFNEGITYNMIEMGLSRGVHYQIINNKLYRTKECYFPARCNGIEHFLLKIVNQIPDVEFIINTKDWPQIIKNSNLKIPILSFSKTSTYEDILYPAWSFWEGGPAISIYPTGIGRWDQMQEKLKFESVKWPWDKKLDKAFFRGSRTSSVRDNLVLLSRKYPHLIDAQYTKNQAWKSDSDTLFAAPAPEVSFENHCQYKYLFNFRGIAASFRFKYLFMCKSLVFHCEDGWMEFFYYSLKPWIHYIPFPPNATQDMILNLLNFAMANQKEAQDIANAGYYFVARYLKLDDITCYWKHLLFKYKDLMKYTPIQNTTLKEIAKHSKNNKYKNKLQ